MAVNRICMGALSISHLQKTTRKRPKKRRPGCLSAGSEYQLPTLRYRGDYGHVLCAVAGSKKKRRKEKKKRRKAADERAECDHKCHKAESRS